MECERWVKVTHLFSCQGGGVMFGTGGISRNREKVLECCTSCTSTNTPDTILLCCATKGAVCLCTTLSLVTVPSDMDRTHCLVRVLVRSTRTCVVQIRTDHVHIGHIGFTIFDQLLNWFYQPTALHSLHAGRLMRPAISGAHRSPIRNIGTESRVVIYLANGIRAKNQSERRMPPVNFHLK